MRKTQELEYNGKRFKVPLIDPDEGFLSIRPRKPGRGRSAPHHAKVLHDLNTVFDLEKYLDPRPPLSCGRLDGAERELFSKPSDAREVLDLPIKFPGTDFRLPTEYAQWEPVVQKVADYEGFVNRRCYDEYWCYLTMRRGPVKAGLPHHPAPCHVDGFQGARWDPKHRINHSYTVSDRLPTLYFPQPFDLRPLDVAKHDVFWEMNRQVAATNARHAWDLAGDYEIVLMDAYCVHIGAEAPEDMYRTWVRLTFETRIFDRLGNAKNPFFDYDWKMVPRDIEQLGLVAFDPDCDPTLRVFPWQAADGSANPPGVVTLPNLRPFG